MGKVIFYKCKCGWKSQGDKYRDFCPDCSEFGVENKVYKDDLEPVKNNVHSVDGKKTS